MHFSPKHGLLHLTTRQESKFAYLIYPSFDGLRQIFWHAGVTIIYPTAMAASAPVPAPAPSAAPLPDATILAFPSDFPFGGPFGPNAGTAVPASFTAPAALSGYNFTQLPANSDLPAVPSGYSVLPVSAGLTAIVPANSSLLQNSAAIDSTITSLPAMLANMAQSPFAGWMQVAGAPPGSLVLQLPTGTSLGQFGGLTALPAPPAGLPAAVYGSESIQDGLSQIFPGSTFTGLYGNILAAAA